MNIVLISFDKMRYDTFGFTGNQQVFTPNIDKLAFDGYVYSNYYASAKESITNRYDIINKSIGRIPINDVHRPIFNDLTKTHYSHLIYDTNNLSFEYPDFIKSFDSWMTVRGSYGDNFWSYDDIELPDNWNFTKDLDEIIYDNNDILFKTDLKLKNYANSNRLREKEEDWTTARLFLLAGQFLKDNASRDDIFLWIDSAGMSDLWEAPSEILKLYQSPESNGNIDPRIFLTQNNFVPASSPKIIDNLLAGYYARITFIDRWIGVLMKTISSAGLNENTVVIISSMSGHTFPTDVLKSFNRPELIYHTPLIVSVPDAGHQKEITPVSSASIHNIIRNISFESSVNSVITDREYDNIIICAASPTTANDFAVTDGISFSYFNDINVTEDNKISETALKFVKSRDFYLKKGS
jgi:hypothetical protein